MNVSDSSANKTLKEKWSVSLAVAAFLALTLFLFAPIQIYLPNSGMFSYMFDKVLWKFLPVTLIALVLLTVLLTILPEKFKLHGKITALALGTALLLWFQGNIILWNYGVLDGRDILWNKLAFRGIIDGLVWLLVLVFIGFKWHTIYKYARQIALLFITIQLIFSTVLFFQYPAAHTAKNFTLLDESVRYQFSSQKNIIVIIVDGFQSDLFWEITTETPAYKKAFDGFTYYRNALSGFPLTTPSIPFILTGEQYDNSIPFQDFVEKVYFTPSSMPWILKEHGYRVDILVDCGRCFMNDKRFISNLKEEVVPLSNSQAGYLFDLTLFRYIPHFAKRVIFNNQNWRFKRYLHDKYDADLPALTKKSNPATGEKFSRRALEELYDVKFAADMIETSQVTTDQNMFKFYHLKGIHAPYRMNEKLDYVEMNLTRPNWKKLGQGSLKIVEIYLAELKRLNIYDNSMIFIIADHGHSTGQWGLNTLPDKTAPMTNPAIVPRHIMSSAIPLILVKRFGTRGAMITSDSPVSLGDIPNTVFTELGIKGEYVGQAMFQVEPDAVRTRHFSFFTYEPGRSTGKFFPPFTPYSVTGHSWLNQSWCQKKSGEK